MGVDIKIEFDEKEAKEFFKSIEGNVEKISNRDKLYAESISPTVYADVIKHFEQEKGSEGKWKKWSKSYSYSIQKYNYPRKPGQILQDTGRLRNTFLPSNWRGTQDGLYWFNNAKTKKGFPYAYAHNEGGPTLPKRDFMWLSNSALNLISKITAAFMVGK